MIHENKAQSIDLVQILRVITLSDLNLLTLVRIQIRYNGGITPTSVYYTSLTTKHK